LKSTALNGCWKKLWLEAVLFFWEFLHQQDEVRISLMVAHKLQEKDFHIWRRLRPRNFSTLLHRLVNHKVKNICRCYGWPGL
jgi:hypothetical protein